MMILAFDLALPTAFNSFLRANLGLAETIKSGLFCSNRAVAVSLPSKQNYSDF